MADAFIGEIRTFGFIFPPKGWALCNGQLMAIAQNQALFALLGTTYGGNGQTTFALPNLQGRCAMHFGNGFTQGQISGEEHHTLTQQEMPQHTHLANASGGDGTLDTPQDGVWAADNAGGLFYRKDGNAGNSQMAPAAIATTGLSQPHNNMAPYLVVNFCIALQGIFPSRN
jgi:microcystin-dependent protein